MWNFSKISRKKLQLFISEILNIVQQTGTGALLIVNNYIPDVIWVNDSHSKDEQGYLSSSSTAVLLKFDSL